MFYNRLGNMIGYVQQKKQLSKPLCADWIIFLDLKE